MNGFKNLFIDAWKNIAGRSAVGAFAGLGKGRCLLCNRAIEIAVGSYLSEICGFRAIIGRAAAVLRLASGYLDLFYVQLLGGGLDRGGVGLPFVVLSIGQGKRGIVLGSAMKKNTIGITEKR